MTIFESSGASSSESESTIFLAVSDALISWEEGIVSENNFVSLFGEPFIDYRAEGNVPWLSVYCLLGVLKGVSLKSEINLGLPKGAVCNLTV